jgi:DegV family protein with EDD domain
MKQPFAIVTDTGHNIPTGVVEGLQLREVPFTINFGVQGSVDDGVLPMEEFVGLLDRYEKGAGYPTTAAPSPGRFADAYRRCIAAGQARILAITISSGLSKTYEAALQGAELVREEHPEAEIEVADSQLGTMAEGFLVMEAAQARDSGLGLVQAKRLVEELSTRLRFLATFETTKYLLKSGRVRSVQHLLSSVLSIRPVISLRGGVVVLFGRVRGRMDKAIESIVDEVRKTRNLGRISVIEGIAPDLKEKLIERLTRAVNVTREQIVESKIGPSFLVHTGKRAVGVVWEEKG